MNDRTNGFFVMSAFLLTFIWAVQAGIVYDDPHSSSVLKAVFSSTSAAWAQALGTVFAFMVAFSIARSEKHRERDKRADAVREGRARARFIAKRLAQIADERVQATAQALEHDPITVTPAGWALTQRTVEADLATMRTFNLHDLEEVKAMQTFALLVGLTQSASDFLEPLAKGALRRSSEMKTYVSDARRNVGQLQAEVSKLRALLIRQLAEIEEAEADPPQKRRAWSLRPIKPKTQP